MIRVWVLDLDNTLYPASSGVFPLVDRRIVEYMAVRLGLPREVIPALRDRYRNEYGLTMGGLVAHHGVDPDEYSRFVHDLPLEELLQPDAALASTLDRLTGDKVVFTNGTVAHARAVLGRLGVQDRVAGIFDIRFMDYIPKPRPHGYRKLIEALGVKPGECVAVDDLPENLDTARSQGMATVLVGPTPAPPHRHVRRVVELADLGDL